MDISSLYGVPITGGMFDVNHDAQLPIAIIRLPEAASLGALYDSGERFDPPKCHPDTRTAVLQKLMDWFVGEFGWDNFVLWLYGPAGSGKSAIAQTFAEICAKMNGLLASFFFSRSDSRRNDEMAFVATLVYQLWIHIPESRPIVKAAINNAMTIFQLNVDAQFRTLFLDPLLQLSSAGRFTSGTPYPNLIITDGLDECKGADVQNAILNTISNAFRCYRSALPFKFLIASRPEYHLTTLFSVDPLHSLTFRLALDDTDQTYEDTRLYLTYSFCDIRNTHIMRAHLPDSWSLEEDIAELVPESSGQPFFVATVNPTWSHQIFIHPSSSHAEAAQFCISAIESLDMVVPLPNLAYHSPLKHLRLAGPLHNNTTLWEKVLEVPHFEYWTTYMLTSEFRQTEELYLHHRGILDHKLRKFLALIPMSPCLAFWSAVSASGILESNRVVTLETFRALSYSLAADLLPSVPGFLFSALFGHIERGNVCLTSTPYLRMVTEYLNDPSRAGSYTVDQSTYTTAAVFVVKFAVKAWDGIKYILPHRDEDAQWDLVWDAFSFMLSKAGYSAYLLDSLGKQNLTFNLGRPETKIRHRVQTLYGAVRNYLLEFKGSNPSPFKIIIDWTQYPNCYDSNCFTADDLDDDQDTWRVIYVDESILPSDEDIQEPAGQSNQPCGNT